LAKARLVGSVRKVGVGGVSVLIYVCEWNKPALLK